MIRERNIIPVVNLTPTTCNVTLTPFHLLLGYSFGQTILETNDSTYSVQTWVGREKHGNWERAELEVQMVIWHVNPHVDFHARFLSCWLATMYF